jgi:hypothetical protein
VSVQSFENHFSVIAKGMVAITKNTNNFEHWMHPHNQLIEITHKVSMGKNLYKYIGKINGEKKSSQVTTMEPFQSHLVEIHNPKERILVVYNNVCNPRFHK